MFIVDKFFKISKAPEEREGFHSTNSPLERYAPPELPLGRIDVSINIRLLRS